MTMTHNEESNPVLAIKSREEVLAEHSRWLCRHFHARPGYRLFYIDEIPDGEITVFKFVEPNITNLHIAIYSMGVVRISDGRPTKDIIYWQDEFMGLMPLLAEIDKCKGNLIAVDIKPILKQSILTEIEEWLKKIPGKFIGSQDMGLLYYKPDLILMKKKEQDAKRFWLEHTWNGMDWVLTSDCTIIQD